jgi:hypothetical protein
MRAGTCVSAGAPRAGALHDGWLVPPIDVSAVGVPTFIGTGQGAWQSLRGVISEIVLVRDATSEDVTRLETYLRFKYRSALRR